MKQLPKNSYSMLMILLTLCTGCSFTRQEHDVQLLDTHTLLTASELGFVDYTHYDFAGVTGECHYTQHVYFFAVADFHELETTMVPQLVAQGWEPLEEAGVFRQLIKDDLYKISFSAAPLYATLFDTAHAVPEAEHFFINILEVRPGLRFCNAY